MLKPGLGRKVILWSRNWWQANKAMLLQEPRQPDEKLNAETSKSLMKTPHLKMIRAYAGKEGCNLVFSGYFRIVQGLKDIYSGRRQVFYLEALSPVEVRRRLEGIGLNQDWVFVDFDEVITEQSSQRLWAKAIVRNKKEAFPSILWKYIHHYKWKENLYELNKIFRYSDGLKELENSIIPHLKFNDNAEKTLSGLRIKETDPRGFPKQIIYKFFRPPLNLVIVSCNTGILIKRFLEREDIRKRLQDNNKIIVRAVVANKMGMDADGNVTGLSHKRNIIDIHTKKDYIPRNNTVLVDKRDSRLRKSHTRVIFIPSDQPENKISE